MDEQIRRDEAQVMFDIFENWPTTASTRRAMQQHILGLQIKLDAAIAAAQPVPAEGAQAEYERGVKDTTKFYLEREDKQKERYDALYALKLGGNLFALDLQKRLEQVNDSFKLIVAAIASPATAAPAGYPKPTKPAE